MSDESNRVIPETFPAMVAAAFQSVPLSVEYEQAYGCRIVRCSIQDDGHRHIRSIRRRRDGERGDLYNPRRRYETCHGVLFNIPERIFSSQAKMIGNECCQFLFDNECISSTIYRLRVIDHWRICTAEKVIEDRFAHIACV